MGSQKPYGWFPERCRNGACHVEDCGEHACSRRFRESEEAMRTFIAVPVPDAGLSALEPVLAALPTRVWRPVLPAQRHLTLRFMGEQPDGAASRWMGQLGAALVGLPAFVVDVCGLGVFPTARRPSVLWAGCGRGAADLVRLASQVDAALRSGGLASTREPFVAHVTLARRRRTADPAHVAPAVASALGRWRGTTWGRCAVSEVVLFRSDLGVQGPTYTRLATWPLAGVG